MKKFLLFIWEIVKIAIIALIIVVPVRAFIFQPFFVRGASMEPNFHDFDYLIVDEISYRFSEPQRGDVIVFYNPNNHSQRFIKRIIGLPGETIRISEGSISIQKDNGEFFILDETDYLDEGVRTLNNREMFLEQEEYFVMGDNRALSLDSRTFGALQRDLIIGKESFRLWPWKILAKD
ncbi:MAG: signal peptidase I [Patescibacteria group bacterium]|nr:signal peptidase I [Patescibacteria group bacterium]